MNLTLTILNVDHARLALPVLQAYIAAHDQKAPAPARVQVDLSAPLSALDLSQRVHNPLAAQGIRTVEDLTAYSANLLRAIPGIGYLAVDQIKNRLAAKGLTLAG